MTQRQLAECRLLAEASPFLSSLPGRSRRSKRTRPISGPASAEDEAVGARVVQTPQGGCPRVEATGLLSLFRLRLEMVSSADLLFLLLVALPLHCKALHSVHESARGDPTSIFVISEEGKRLGQVTSSSVSTPSPPPAWGVSLYVMNSAYSASVCFCACTASALFVQRATTTPRGALGATTDGATAIAARHTTGFMLRLGVPALGMRGTGAVTAGPRDDRPPQAAGAGASPRRPPER